MRQRIDRQALERITQARNIEALSARELVELFRAEEGMADYLPHGAWEVDPRSGDRVLFNTSRARRPHDNRPASSDEADASGAERPCVICQGNTTGVVDVAELSQGFTFINKNLYPILYPLPVDRVGRAGSAERTACGLHFLQWTSSLHDRDWHNMPVADCTVVMRRLAALERMLLSDAWDFLCHPDPEADRLGGPGFVLIIKNYGRLVGGSLAHGHQQIAFSTVAPRRMLDNERFEREHGEPFSAFLLRENPAPLTVRDYGPAVLLVPYFMRRPYDMLLLVKDTGKKHLFELTAAELAAVAAGWHDAIRAMRWIMPRIGREIAYNVVANNGPGAGLYFEFLPYVQEIGGVEHLGLFVSQGDPEDVATQVRRYLEQH